MSEFEKIIKDKLDAFEYKYDKSSWTKFKKQLPGKSNFLNFAAALSIVVISVIGLYWYFNTNNERQKSDFINTVNNNTAPDNQKSEISVSSNDYAIQKNQSIKTNQVKVINNQTKANENIINNADNQQTVLCNSKISDNSTISDVKPSKPNATFICDVTEGCSPFTVKFTPAELSDTTIYSWDFGDGTISTEKTPTHTYIKSGNFSVLLMVKYYKSEPVISNLRQNMIKVNEVPVSNFAFQNNGYTFNFTNLTTGCQKFKWLFPDSVSNDENCIKNYCLNGKYTVKLIAINKSGCSDTSSKTIEVKVKHPIYFATAFTPGIDGENSTFGPKVQNTEEYYFVFEIFNKTGQCVYEAKGNNVTWDGINKNTRQPADADFYFYKLKAKDKFGNTDEKNGKFNLLR